MSDDQHWQPPAGLDGTQPGEASHSSFAGPAPHSQPAAPAAWTPPPKPGLIPLRPLTLGNILSGSFQVLRRNPKPTFGISLATQGVIMLVTVLVIGFVTFSAVTRLSSASSQDAPEIAAGAVASGILATLIPLVLSVIAAALIQGIIVIEVQRATLGEKQQLKQLWRRARGRLGALVGWTLLLSAIVTVAIALLVAVVWLFVGLFGTVGIVLGVLIGIVGGLAVIAGTFWLGTKLALVPSILMAERGTIRESISRSWSLTNGYFWRTLGIQLLVATILSVVSQVVATPISFLGPMVVFLIDPNGTGGPTTMVVLVATYLITIAVTAVFSAIILVVQSACTALIYIDLRMRKEGLDLELSRFVEESHAGTAPAADPYLVTPRT